MAVALVTTCICMCIRIVAEAQQLFPRGAMQLSVHATWLQMAVRLTRLRLTSHIRVLLAMKTRSAPTWTAATRSISPRFNTRAPTYMWRKADGGKVGDHGASRRCCTLCQYCVKLASVSMGLPVDGVMNSEWWESGPLSRQAIMAGRPYVIHL